MRRGRVFVNSVFHNMWGEFDVNRALFFGGNLHKPKKKCTFANELIQCSI